MIGRGTFGTVQIAEWDLMSHVAVKSISWDDGSGHVELRKLQVLLMQGEYNCTLWFWAACFTLFSLVWPLPTLNPQHLGSTGSEYAMQPPISEHSQIFWHL